MADDENAQRSREGWEWERELEAQGHGGVWRRSRLERVCIGGRSDDQLRTKVRETLLRCRVDASAVEVEVCDGLVVLTGVVSNGEEKTVVESVSARVHGVRGVRSQLGLALTRHVR